MAVKKRKKKRTEKSEKRKFTYKSRSADAVKKRATQAGGAWDTVTRQEFNNFKPKDGHFTLRVLPSTWGEQDHYGLNTFVHYGIGSDDATYLCPAKTFSKDCAICDAEARAKSEGLDEFASQISARKRVSIYVIDRDNEDDGPLIWMAPWTFDRDLASLTVHKKTGQVIEVDNPEDGYDIEFTKEGVGLKTKYFGLQVERDPSPLSDDEDTAERWIDFIVENPLTSVFSEYDYDYLEKIVAGTSQTVDDDEEEEDDDEEAEAEEDSVEEDEDEEDEDEEDEDEDDDEDDDEDEEDEEDDDDDDEDPPWDDDDDEEEDEAPPPPKKKKVKKKKSKVAAKLAKVKKRRAA